MSGGMLPRKLLLKIVASLVFAFAVTVAITWAVEDYLSARNAMKVINRVLDDVQGEIEEHVNRKLVLAAMEVRDRIPQMRRPNTAALRALATELRVDEACVVGKDGVVIASSDAGANGFDFHCGDVREREFLCLLDAESEYCQSFRRRAGGKEGCKYVGVWLPEGGFVQVGCLARTLRVFAQSAVTGLTHHRHVADSGTVIITTEQGHIISDAKETGLEGSVLRLPIDDAYVVQRVIEGFDVYAVLPKAVAVVERNTLVASSAVMTIIALCFVAGLVGIVISKFVREQVGARIQEEMAMAKSIQTNVLPSRFPPYPNLVDKIDIFAQMKTAKDVGGDFYDFYFVGSKKLALVIADVSGKGIPAALFMMRAKATIQSFLKSGLGVVEAICEANHRLAKRNDANMFVTAWIGVIDLQTGNVEYVNAGHNPPLVKRAGGSVEYLRAKSGPPLAAMDGVCYRLQTLALGPGDGVLLYTDGVTEATNRTNELYGEERLQRTMQGLLGAHDAGALIDGIQKDVNAFVDGAEQADDITLLAFKLVKF